jgi:hypothetical protein
MRCHLPCPALQENERLLELLGHMDSECTRLTSERQEMLAELAQLQGTAAAAALGDRQGSNSADRCTGESAAPGSGEIQHNQQLQQRQAHLDVELQKERQRRQQAERDFQDLLGSLDLLHTPSPASSTCGSLQQREAGAADAAAAAEAAAAVGGLQAAVSQLQQENEQLRGELLHTRGSVQGLQASYTAAAAASTSLQHIAHGLHSISSGSGFNCLPAAAESRGGLQGRGGRSGAQWQQQ